MFLISVLLVTGWGKKWHEEKSEKWLITSCGLCSLLPLFSRETFGFSHTLIPLIIFAPYALTTCGGT